MLAPPTSSTSIDLHAEFCLRMFTLPSEKQKRKRKRHLNNSQFTIVSCMRAFGLQVLLLDPGFRTAALIWPVLSHSGQEEAEVVVYNDKKHMRWLTHKSNLEQFFWGLISRLLLGTFSHVAWQFDIWTVVTVNWHNCQLLLRKEFLLLFQLKPQQPENSVLSINHKALTHCSSVSWVRASSLFRERQRLSSETTPSSTNLSPTPSYTVTDVDPSTPQRSHFLLYVALIGGVLVNQSCQNINGSSRIVLHGIRSTPRVL